MTDKKFNNQPGKADRGKREVKKSEPTLQEQIQLMIDLHDRCVSSLSRIQTSDILGNYTLIEDELINDLMTNYWYQVSQQRLKVSFIQAPKNPQFWNPEIKTPVSLKDYNEAVIQDSEFIGRLMNIGVINEKSNPDEIANACKKWSTEPMIKINLTSNEPVTIILPEMMIEKLQNHPILSQAKMVFIAYLALENLKLCDLFNQNIIDLTRFRSMSPNTIKMATMIEARFLTKHGSGLNPISDYFTKNMDEFERQDIPDEAFGVTRIGETSQYPLRNS